MREHYNVACLAVSCGWLAAGQFGMALAHGILHAALLLRFLQAISVANSTLLRLEISLQSCCQAEHCCWCCASDLSIHVVLAYYSGLNVHHCSF